MVTMSTLTFPRHRKMKIGHRSISQWSLTSTRSDFYQWTPGEISYSSESPREVVHPRNAFELPASQLEEYVAYLEQRLKEACLGLNFRSVSLTDLNRSDVNSENSGQGLKNATWSQNKQPLRLTYPIELHHSMYPVR